jgi:hypothetical protein
VKTELARIYKNDKARVKLAMDKRNATGEARFTFADSMHLIIERSSRMDQMVTFYELELSRLRKVINNQNANCIHKKSAS